VLEIAPDPADPAAGSGWIRQFPETAGSDTGTPQKRPKRPNTRWIRPQDQTAGPDPANCQSQSQSLNRALDAVDATCRGQFVKHTIDQTDVLNVQPVKSVKSVKKVQWLVVLASAKSGHTELSANHGNG
jgi:hypothetical protein